ncbi:hypothetical protein D3C71_1820960 [compost metagenome]
MLIEVTNQQHFHVGLDNLLEQIEVMPAEVLHLVDADLVVVALHSALKRRNAAIYI